ncbi:MAG: protein kinase, partial [Deltaproteobacteria bacterium]|nr:protein kinase [Nannocystaceae bacterium]
MRPSISSSGDLPAGTRMGRYELLHRLAVGGMAELYVARHSGIQGFERTVVVKRILPHLVEDPEFISMFLDEARIAASLDHPNIAQVTDIDHEHGDYFLTMEYVHGKNLREVLRQAPQGLPLGMALAVVIGVTAGLHHAHEALGSDGRPLGLVHRDVSPSNVMIAFSGAVKLTDFGIAKAAARTSKTLAGRIKGKVGYMSPEQCRGEQVDRRSDIFSLGILAYETLTGARAFYAPNEFAAMARIVRCDYTRPSELVPGFPLELERIIARALQKEPDDRYATAEQMQLELEAFAEAQGRTPSAIELAAHMRGVFGTPPHPQTLSVTRPATEAAGPTVRTSPSYRPGVSRTVLWSAIGTTALIVGASALGVKVARALQEGESQGVDFVGYFDDRTDGRIDSEAKSRVLGTLSDVAAYTSANGVKEVYITLPLGSQPRIVELLDQLQGTTASLFFVPDVFGISIVQGRLQDMNGVPVVGICETPFTGT